MFGTLYNLMKFYTNIDIYIAIEADFKSYLWTSEEQP